MMKFILSKEESQSNMDGLDDGYSDHQEVQGASGRQLVQKLNLFPTQVFQLVAERLKKTHDGKVGKHNSFREHVANELNSMTPEMVPYVKKIISLAIFEVT